MNFDLERYRTLVQPLDESGIELHGSAANEAIVELAGPISVSPIVGTL